MINPSGAQEVADVLAITFEREDVNGSPWCPPRDAAAVHRWVIDRSRELGGGIRRAVRLARLAQLADGRDYTRFLYVRLTALRGRNFAEALGSAANGGRFGGGLVSLSSTGVALCNDPPHSQSASTPAGFEIDFNQMPRLAALLDILHNALGYGPVVETLEPVLKSNATAEAADDVARSLHAAFNAWLSERLESPYHIRQARYMRAFIATRGRVTHDAINDAAILAFWEAMATGPQANEIEGFRLYRSAARALLRYRQALRDAQVAKSVLQATDLGTELERGQIDLDRLVPQELETGTWQSPMTTLAAAPANGIKWLNKRERLYLSNYLGGPPPEDESAADPIGEEPVGGLETGLAGEERFDLNFRRTLLRADVFGAVQGAIVARLRKRAGPGTAISEAFDGLDVQAYENCRAGYAQIGAQLRLEALAALDAMLELATTEAALLLHRLTGRDAIDDLIGGQDTDQRAGKPNVRTRPPTMTRHATGGEPDADLACILASLRALRHQPQQRVPGPIGEILAATKAAARRVNREGFRPPDRSDPERLHAMSSGTTAVIGALDELERLDAALMRADLRTEMAADRTAFHAGFVALYSGMPARQD